MAIIRLQNLSKASKSLPKFSFKIFTKPQLQNFYQTSTSKSRPKISFNFSAKPHLILTNFQPQHHYQTSALISWPKSRFKISTKSQPQNFDQTVVNTLLSISNTMTTSRSFELASSKSRVTSVKSTILGNPDDATTQNCLPQVKGRLEFFRKFTRPLVIVSYKGR